jgi:PhnB protein
MHTARVKRILDHVKNPAQAECVLSALAEVAKCNASPTTFGAARFGMLIDRFSIPWMLNCEQAT